MGGLSQALANAAKAAGAEIRTSARVSQISGAYGDKPKVVLEGGEEIESRVVVSNADPRTTFLNLVDPVDLDPNFLLKMRNYRAPGVVGKDQSRALGFAGVSRRERAIRQRNSRDAFTSVRRSTISSVLSMLRSMASFPRDPYLDISIPSLGDPSLAPAGKHVMSIHVQFAPYKLKQGDWTTRREEFASNVIEQARSSMRRASAS